MRKVDDDDEGGRKEKFAKLTEKCFIKVSLEKGSNVGLSYQKQFASLLAHIGSFHGWIWNVSVYEEIYQSSDGDYKKVFMKQTRLIPRLPKRRLMCDCVRVYAELEIWRNIKV